MIIKKIFFVYVFFIVFGFFMGYMGDDIYCEDLFFLVVFL